MAKRNMLVTRRTNSKGYGIVMLLGFIGGIGLYHFWGKAIDGLWAKVPYLNKVPSYYGSEFY
jgi:hypothetical protein